MIAWPAKPDTLFWMAPGCVLTPFRVVGAVTVPRLRRYRQMGAATGWLPEVDSCSVRRRSGFP